MTLTEFRNRPYQQAEAIGFVILEKDEYTVEPFDENGKAIIKIKGQEKLEGYSEDDEFFIKKGSLIVWMDDFRWFPEPLESVYSVRIQDIKIK